MTLEEFSIKSVGISANSQIKSPKCFLIFFVCPSLLKKSATLLMKHRVSSFFPFSYLFLFFFVIALYIFTLIIPTLALVPDDLLFPLTSVSKWLEFAWSYSSPSTLRIFINCNSGDDFKEGISPSSMIALPK